MTIMSQNNVQSTIRRRRGFRETEENVSSTEILPLLACSRTGSRVNEFALQDPVEGAEGPAVVPAPTCTPLDLSVFKHTNLVSPVEEAVSESAHPAPKSSPEQIHPVETSLDDLATLLKNGNSDPKLMREFLWHIGETKEIWNLWFKPNMVARDSALEKAMWRYVYKMGLSNYSRHLLLIRWKLLESSVWNTARMNEELKGENEEKGDSVEVPEKARKASECLYNDLRLDEWLREHKILPDLVDALARGELEVFDRWIPFVSDTIARWIWKKSYVSLSCARHNALLDRMFDPLHSSRPVFQPPLSVMMAVCYAGNLEMYRRFVKPFLKKHKDFNQLFLMSHQAMLGKNWEICNAMLSHYTEKLTEKPEVPKKLQKLSCWVYPLSCYGKYEGRCMCQQKNCWLNARPVDLPKHKVTPPYRHTGDATFVKTIEHFHCGAASLWGEPTFVRTFLNNGMVPRDTDLTIVACHAPLGTVQYLWIQGAEFGAKQRVAAMAYSQDGVANFLLKTTPREKLSGKHLDTMFAVAARSGNTKALKALLRRFPRYDLFGSCFKRSRDQRLALGDLVCQSGNVRALKIVYKYLGDSAFDQKTLLAAVSSKSKGTVDMLAHLLAHLRSRGINWHPDVCLFAKNNVAVLSWLEKNGAPLCSSIPTHIPLIKKKREAEAMKQRARARKGGAH